MLEFNGTILIAIVSFVIFAFIMNKILYAPLWNIVEERKTFVDANLSNAMHTKEKAQAILDDKEEKLKAAHKEAVDSVNLGVEKAKESKSSAVSQANQASREKIEDAKAKLFGEESEARTALKDNISELAKDISEKLLKQEVSHFDFNQELVDEAMNNV